MSNDILDDADTEHIVEIPNVEETQAGKKPENSGSVKGFIIEVVCSEGFLLLLGLIAIALDPLFFYVPMVKNNSTCLGLDKTLIIVLAIMRTLVDIFHDWSWWSKSPNSKSQNSKDKGAINKSLTDRLLNLLKWRSRNHQMSSPKRRSSVPVRFTRWFTNCKISSPDGRSSIAARLIAIIASLPLLQVVVLAIDFQSHLKAWLKFGVLCQFIPRIFRTYPTYVAATTSSDIYAWIGAAFNLLLFVLASHALGGFWYLRTVERKLDCMEEACRNHLGCTVSSLYCDSGNYAANNGFINDVCAAQPTSNATTPFDYGMYGDAVKSNLIGSKNFLDKLVDGFWWGIRNLSSMAQNLELSDYTWDTCFAILICILGLLLFALLIGNLQMYLQSKMPSTLAKLKEKREELHSWAPFHSLSPQLRKEVSMCRHSKWQEVREVNVESLLNNIPWELKRKLKLHFCENLFHKVKEFENLDPKMKKLLRERAKPVVFEARTNIHEEGHPIYEMFHIVHGKVLAYNNHDIKEGLHAKELEKDDSFGKEVLLRALESHSPKLTLAAQTIQSVTKVEAFALSFDDFIKVLTKYERSPIENVWAANVIGYRYKRMRGKSSQEGKDESHNGKKSLEITHIAPESSSS